MTKELITLEHDIPAFQKKLARLAGKLGDTRPLKKAIGEHLLTATEDRFDTQTGPDGNKWQDVKPRTKKRKKHSKVLTEQGHLRGDINYQVTDDSLLLGVGIAYGAIHQLGGDIEQPARTGVVTHFKKVGKGQRFSKAKHADSKRSLNHKAHTITMPARPFLGISRADEIEIIEIAKDHLKL